MVDTAQLYADLTTQVYDAAANFISVGQNSLQNAAASNKCLNDFSQGFKLVLQNNSQIRVTGNFEIRQTARAAVTCLGGENERAQKAFEAHLTKSLVTVLLKYGIAEKEEVLTTEVSRRVAATLQPCWRNAATGGGKRPIGGSNSSGFAQITSVALNGSTFLVGCSDEKVERLAKQCASSLEPGQKTGSTSACTAVADCILQGGDLLIESNAETDTTCPALGQIATDIINYLSEQNLLAKKSNETSNFFESYGIWIAIGIFILLLIIFIVLTMRKPSSSVYTPYPPDKWSIYK